MQGRIEVQILDSFGLSGENNECGGIYTIAKPSVNMCLPPLQWQTYDVEYTAAKYDADKKKTTNAKMDVRHNGVLIHENVELRRAHDRSVQEGPEPGPISTSKTTATRSASETFGGREEVAKRRHLTTETQRAQRDLPQISSVLSASLW